MQKPFFRFAQFHHTLGGAQRFSTPAAGRATRVAHCSLRGKTQFTHKRPFSGNGCQYKGPSLNLKANTLGCHWIFHFSFLEAFPSNHDTLKIHNRLVDKTRTALDCVLLNGLNRLFTAIP